MNLHLQLVIAYDGTRYAGWQRQRNAPTIQAELEKALRTLTGRRVIVTASGRTDAGVHAQGQVAHVRLQTRLTPTALRKSLNAILPPDIVIRSIQNVPGTFHARYDARRKWYRYRVVTGPEKPLFERAVVHHVPQRLNVAAMRRAARVWVGRHDFRAFHSAGRSVASAIRTVHSLRVTQRGRAITMDITADGFLYHQARRMVGTLIEIGKGRWSPDIAATFVGRHRPPISAPTAPAKGLCLMRVAYA